MSAKEVFSVSRNGKTSVTLTADELFYMKSALSAEIEKVAGFAESGDPHGVWTKTLSELKSAYKKIDQALGRV